MEIVTNGSSITLTITTIVGILLTIITIITVYGILNLTNGNIELTNSL